jgi:hypothetical protein
MINKSYAPVIVLSPTKRTAVIECFSDKGLHKCNGYWCGGPEGTHISGVTVADLARDGMFFVVINRPLGAIDRTRRMVCTDTDRSCKRSTSARIAVRFTCCIAANPPINSAAMGQMRRFGPIRRGLLYFKERPEMRPAGTVGPYARM